jgi:hypothetical protein
MTPGRNDITDLHTRRQPIGRRDVTQLAKLPSRRSSGEAGGRVLYLPLTGLIVVPHLQLAGMWDCLVLADPTGARQPGSTYCVADLEIETALPVPLGNPLGDLGADEFAALWLTRLWARVRGGYTYAVARVLAEDLRPRGNRTIVWDEPARRRTMTSAHVLAPGLRRLIDGLIRDGLLRPLPAGNAADPPIYRLTLPDQRWTEPPSYDTRM